MNPNDNQLFTAGDVRFRLSDVIRVWRTDDEDLLAALPARWASEKLHIICIPLEKEALFFEAVGCEAIPRKLDQLDRYNLEAGGTF